MKALSVRAPWWWFILYAGKDIENRNWKCNRIGTIAIHASTWWNEVQVYGEAWRMKETLEKQGLWPEGLIIPLPEIKALGGHVIGKVQIIGCVQESESPWFFGPNGIILQNAKPLENPFPQKGKLSFFDVSIPWDS